MRAQSKIKTKDELTQTKSELNIKQMFFLHQIHYMMNLTFFFFPLLPMHLHVPHLGYISNSQGYRFWTMTSNPLHNVALHHHLLNKSHRYNNLLNKPHRYNSQHDKHHFLHPRHRQCKNCHVDQNQRSSTSLTALLKRTKMMFR